ncbi:MAG: hypothetical protein KDD58_07380 [Bdellovibrionales bacterium]|nr:hypothetical protein [Bdellovibrionales bacterium]
MALEKKDYESFEIARSNQLDKQLEQTLEQRKVGKNHSLKHTVLNYVVEGDYNAAKSTLTDYIELQREYPNFFKRARAYIDHCFDVIQAIKSKRDFPGKHLLPMSKQQELMEKVVDHFEELKHYLNRIEIAQKDAKLEDLRSTVWVIKAFTYCLFIIVLVIFVRYAAMSILSSFDYVIDDTTNDIVNWFFDLF